MNQLRKHSLLAFVKEVVLLCLGVLVFCLAEKLLGRLAAGSELLPALSVSVGLLLLFDAVCLLIYERVMQSGGKMAVGFYLLTKTLRLLLAILILLVYAFVDCRHLLDFAIALFVLYVVQMVVSIQHQVKMERTNKQISEGNKQPQ